MSQIGMVQIFSEIMTERAMQDAEYGGPLHDDRHSPLEWMSILMRHLGLAAGDAAVVDPQRYRRQLVRVAAVAVAALESWDRLHPDKPAGPIHTGEGF